MLGTCRFCSQPFEKPTYRFRTCPPCKKAGARRRSDAFAAAHPEKLRANRKKWRDAHPDLNREVCERWRLANMERTRVYRRAGKKRNPDANRATVQARKARKRALSVVPFTAEQLRQRLQYYGNRCWMCGGPNESLDHVKPLSKGGAHILANLRPACLECNSRKGTRWPLEAIA